MKQILKLVFTNIFMLYTVWSFGQLSNVPLSNATGGDPHYGAGVNRSEFPAFILSDPFAYDPNNPTSVSPIQTQGQAPDTTNFLPVADDQHNWWAAEMNITAGMALSVIDIWGRTEAGDGIADRHKELVITLSNDSYSWTSEEFDGVSLLSATPPSYGRMDLRAAGVTHDLLKTATKIRFDKPNGNNGFLHLTEVRLASGSDPSIGDNTSPVLSDASSGTVEVGLDISVTSDEDATIYLVPSETAKNANDIRTASIATDYAFANDVLSIATVGFEGDDLVFYAIDLAGNISDATPVLTLVGDEIAPVLSGITTDPVTIGAFIAATSNENGRIYVVPDTTIKNLDSIKNASVTDASAVADEIVNLSTNGIAAGTYAVYAVDVSDNISDAAAVTLEEKPQVTLVPFTLANAAGGARHYGEATGRNQLPLYNINDKFIYDPNDPTATTPEQDGTPGFNGGPGDTTFYFSKAEDAENYWEADIIMPDDGSLVVIDLWGRFPSDEGIIPRFRDLVFTIRDDIDSWTSPSWDGISDPTAATAPSYGRFDFTLAGAPASLLSSATHIRIDHSDGSPEFLEIHEIRIAGTGTIINNTPLADAGPDQTVDEKTEVTLDASDSEDFDDGDVLSFSWSAPAGITLSDTEATNPTFMAPEVDGDSVLTFTVLVSDGIASAQASVDITVKNVVPNQAPSADAGVAQVVDEGETVTLDGSGSSDPENSDLTYVWTAPTEISLSSTTAASPTFTAPSVDADTDYTFKLIVNDGELASNEATVVITVKDLGDVTAVNASLSNLSIYPNPSSNGFTVDLTGTSSISSLKVFNSTGQQMHTIEVDNSLEVSIGPEVFSGKGIYYIVFSGNLASTVQKIVVE